MRIGIFGDSYAEKNIGPGAWWRLLADQHGHCTTSFGASGSSILYSAKQIDKHGKDFDFNIWCLTCPGRFSVKIGDNDRDEDFWHSTSVMNAQGDMYTKTDKVDQNIVDTCHRYLKYIFDQEEENLVGQALVHYLLDRVPNLMVIPCFDPPLQMSFNLYKLCELEIQTFFPNQKVYEIYRDYQDIRLCHLSRTNNKILASLIDQNLRPGIFSANYEEFCFDNLILTELLAPRHIL